MIPYLFHSDPPMISLSLSDLELSLLLSSMALYILMADFRFSLDPLYHSLTLLISEVILHTSSLADAPGFAWLVLLSLQVPPLIVNLLDDPSYGLRPGVALSIPSLSHHYLGLFDFPHDQLGPVPDISPLPLRRPQDFTKIFKLPQYIIGPPFHLHRRIFLLPTGFPLLSPPIYISSKNITPPCLLIFWRPSVPFFYDNDYIY